MFQVHRILEAENACDKYQESITPQGTQLVVLETEGELNLGLFSGIRAVSGFIRRISGSGIKKIVEIVSNDNYFFYIKIQKIERKKMIIGRKKRRKMKKKNLQFFLYTKNYIQLDIRYPAKLYAGYPSKSSIRCLQPQLKSL